MDTLFPDTPLDIYTSTNSTPYCGTQGAEMYKNVDVEHSTRIQCVNITVLVN